LLFSDGQAVRDVGEQDAGARAVEVGVGEDGTETLGIRGIVIGDAEDLETVEINGFVVEDADAGIANGAEIAVGVGEFVVIAGDEVGAEFGGELAPGRDEARRVDVRAVEHVAADEDDVGAKLAELGDDAGDEVAALDVTEMRVGDEGSNASAPGGGEAREFHCDALNAESGGVGEAVERGEHGEAEEEERDARLAEGQIENDRDCDRDPRQACGGEGEVHETEPDAGEAVVGSHRAIEEAMREKRRGQEADGEDGK